MTMVEPYEWTTSQLVSFETFLPKIEEYRSAGQKIVTTNGCFDLIHAGHVRFLEQAKALGDILIVGLNSDRAVHQLKGNGRPLLPETERAALMAALKPVDHVVVFDDLLPIQFLGAIRPTVHCKAGDYSMDGLPEMDIILQNGGRVEILPYVSGYSTSRFIERVLMSQKHPGSLEAKQAMQATNFGIMEYFISSGNVLRQTGYHLADDIQVVGGLIAKTLHTHKVLICGNGGSAADAQHFAAELVGRFRRERAAWPALSLSTDPSILTAVGNDYGYDQVFARQVAAWGQEGDVLVAISTSGTSPNVLAAVQEAKRLKMKTVALTGGKPSLLAEESDYVLKAPSEDTPLIQQTHITIIHALCSIIEAALT